MNPQLASLIGKRVHFIGIGGAGMSGLARIALSHGITVSGSDAKRGVYILTARAAYKPVYDFIRDLGIKGVYVVALGDNNPESKADWIEAKVKDEGFDDVYFVDDSLKNVDAVRRRLANYPSIKKRVQHVKHS